MPKIWAKMWHKQLQGMVHLIAWLDLCTAVLQCCNAQESKAWRLRLIVWSDATWNMQDAARSIHWLLFYQVWLCHWHSSPHVDLEVCIAHRGRSPTHQPPKWLSPAQLQPGIHIHASLSLVKLHPGFCHRPRSPLQEVSLTAFFQLHLVEVVDFFVDAFVAKQLSLSKCAQCPTWLEHHPP